MLFHKVVFVICIVLIIGCQATADSSINSSNSNFSSGVILHHEDDDDKNCPVGLVSGLSLDDEFGPGTSEITRCIQKTPVKVVYQINITCGDEACNKPYALGNIQNAINDYQITHGLMLGKDFEIIAVAYSGGYRLMTANNAQQAFGEENPFQEQVESLIEQGVKIYFCQNTSRSKGIVTANLIPGIKYVTSGVTALADFQLLGYAYMQP